MTRETLTVNMAAHQRGIYDCRDCWFCRVSWGKAACVNPRNPYHRKEVLDFPTEKTLVKLVNVTEVPGIPIPAWCALPFIANLQQL